ncbi:hypothetical protein GCM10018779_53390 [Streptomyces griseocarneus]|nr:hypothetical protein GCM10018779_53390 [Streptomyces griseocarneus]
MANGGTCGGGTRSRCRGTGSVWCASSCVHAFMLRLSVRAARALGRLTGCRAQNVPRSVRSGHHGTAGSGSKPPKT